MDRPRDTRSKLATRRARSSRRPARLCTAPTRSYARRFRSGQRETQRVPIRATAFPAPSIPYIGVSYVMLESAIAEARRRGDSAITQLTMIPAQLTPQRTRAWFPAADSAEVSYFGVA